MAIRIGQAGTAAYKSAGTSDLAGRVDRSDRMTSRQIHDLARWSVKNASELASKTSARCFVVIEADFV
jgi:hypothetical protein